MLECFKHQTIQYAYIHSSLFLSTDPTYVLFMELGYTANEVPGKWLWRSWQSGRFQYQRTRVQIQSSATFIEHLLTVNCL